MTTGGRTPNAPRLDESARWPYHLTMTDHHGPLRRFLVRMGMSVHAAEDVAQSAFVVALEAMPRIAPGSERAFLYATATRLAYDARRRARREIVRADLDLDSSPMPAPDDLAHQKQIREMFESVLEGIERESRAVLIGFDVDGFTIPEIAHALEIPAEAATCRLRRARKRLRAMVKDMAMS